MSKLSQCHCHFCGDDHAGTDPCDEALEAMDAAIDACYGCGEANLVWDLNLCAHCGSGSCDSPECAGVCECSVYEVAEALVDSARNVAI